MSDDILHTGRADHEPVTRDLDELIAEESARNPEFAAGVAATERETAYVAGVAAGRAQAAADIRGELENCPNLQIWDAGAGHIVDYCARLAEGISHTECLDKENTE